MRAQQTQMELLVENILMYMQAVNHDQLSEVQICANVLDLPFANCFLAFQVGLMSEQYKVGNLQVKKIKLMPYMFFQL